MGRRRHVGSRTHVYREGNRDGAGPEPPAIAQGTTALDSRGLASSAGIASIAYVIRSADWSVMSPAIPDLSSWIANP
jgi:hypothetical protein